MILGSTPADEYALILASGSRPSSSAFFADIMATTAAPSFRPDALPAVTVPSLLKAGFRPLSDSTVVPCLMNSSLSNTVGPFFDAISMGTISPLNLPAFCAASAFCCEAAANSSCSRREIPKPLAQDHFRHLLGLHTRFPEQRLDDVRAQIGSRNLREGAAELADRGSQCCDDDNFVHIQSPLALSRCDENILAHCALALTYRPG